MQSMNLNTGVPNMMPTKQIDLFDTSDIPTESRLDYENISVIELCRLEKEGDVGADEELRRRRNEEIQNRISGRDGVD